LRYVGFGVAGAYATHALGPLLRHADGAAEVVGPARAFSQFNPVAYPLPHPADGGSAGTDAAQFAEYVVRDDIVLPDGFRYDVLAQWGDAFGPEGKQIRFGFNADFTGLLPVPGAPGEHFLFVNHEYISGKPWIQGKALDLAEITLDGELFPSADQARLLCRAAMEDLGYSLLHVRRLADGSFEVIKDSPRHRRMHGFGVANIDDPQPVRISGPAAALVGTPRGTYSNCSGGTTPWGTFLSCEENFQDQSPEFINPAGQPLAGDTKPLIGIGYDGLVRAPFEFEGLGQGIEPPLDGRQYGWVCEVDPNTGVLTKHTGLGRFRHENVAVRAESGQKLAAYMGDDRRGGHVWKFVSDVILEDPTDSANASLFARGTLYVARFESNFTGRWIPLRLDTPLVRPEPEHCSLGSVWLPKRPDGGHRQYGIRMRGVEEWIESVEKFSGKKFDQMTAGDLVDARVTDASQRLGVLMLDAYVMGNTVGGTPSARPEDIEIHPTDGSVYVAFTDNSGSGDGSPDARIFPDSAGENSRQYGAIYRIVEDQNNPAAETFTWGKFISAGELAERGGGFACADNLVFDPRGNLWIVTDLSTPNHNHPVNRRKLTQTTPGAGKFMGIFGNNSLFMVPTEGEHAGVPHCFAIAPMESELTGPTFTPDGEALILSVQHPGELFGARGRSDIDRAQEEIRMMHLTTREGVPFVQKRTVPLGSNFPGGKPGDIPRPCVVVIRRNG